MKSDKKSDFFLSQAPPLHICGRVLPENAYNTIITAFRKDDTVILCVIMQIQFKRINIISSWKSDKSISV